MRVSLPRRPIIFSRAAARGRVFLRASALLLALGLVSGCMSSSIDTAGALGSAANQPQRQAAAGGTLPASASEPLALVPPATSEDVVTASTSLPASAGSIEPSETSLQPAPDDASQAERAAREEGLAEIRRKASEGTGQPPRIGDVPVAATEQMSDAERARLLRELEGDVARSQAEISDAELAARQATIREMQRRAITHYESTLKSIE